MAQTDQTMARSAQRDRPGSISRVAQRKMENGLEHEHIVELLEENSAVIREDLSLIGAGTIKLVLFEADVTHDHYARLRTVLRRNEAIIDALKGSDE